MSYWTKQLHVNDVRSLSGLSRLVSIAGNHERFVESRSPASNSNFEPSDIVHFDDVSCPYRSGPPPVKSWTLDVVKHAEPSERCLFSGLYGEKTAPNPHEKSDREQA